MGNRTTKQRAENPRQQQEEPRRHSSDYGPTKGYATENRVVKLCINEVMPQISNDNIDRRLAGTVASPGPDSHTPLTLLFSLQSRVTGQPLLSIKCIDNLSLDDQLRVFDPSANITQQSRDQETSSLFDKVPDLRNNASIRNLFTETLAAYATAIQSAQSIRPSRWTKHQLSFSLFAYLMQYLRRIPHDHMDRTPKRVASALRFVDFTHRYCVDQDFDGIQMLSFWNELTANGQKTSTFGFSFLKKICKQYALKIDQFTKIKKQIRLWYEDSQYDFESCLRSFITENNINSSKLATMPTEELDQLLLNSKNHSFGGRFSVTPSVLRVAIKEGALLTWSHVVAAVRHEMYSVMATSLQKVIACVNEFDFRTESVEKVLTALKTEKGGLSGNEQEYMEQLVQRAAAFRRSQMPVGCQKS